MRGLVFTTAAVIALGLGAAAPGYASNYSTKASGTTTPTTAASQQSQSSQTGKTMSATHMSRSSTAITTAKTGRSPTQVRLLQKRLKAAGLYKGRIDGKFGPMTRLALARFERTHHAGVTASQGSSMPPRHAVKKMTPSSSKTPSQAGSSKPQTTKSGAGSGSSQPPQETGSNAGSNAGGTQLNKQK